MKIQFFFRNCWSQSESLFCRAIRRRRRRPLASPATSAMSSTLLFLLDHWSNGIPPVKGMRKVLGCFSDTRLDISGSVSPLPDPDSNPSTTGGGVGIERILKKIPDKNEKKLVYATFQRLKPSLPCYLEILTARTLFFLSSQLQGFEQPARLVRCTLLLLRVQLQIS